MNKVALAFENERNWYKESTSNGISAEYRKGYLAAMDKAKMIYMEIIIKDEKRKKARRKKVSKMW